MDLKITMIPLSGVYDHSPPCHLLEINEVKFLLDCGWNENFGMDLINNLKKYVHDIDAVFLSHADPYHLGALPYLVGKLGLRCPIYATIPVFRMGQLSMYDVYQSKNCSENFNLFTLDDVDKAFDMITKLAYNETVYFEGRQGTSLQISALPAGHMIGGAIWKINKEENQLVVYGVDYNHRKERHLDSCSFDNIFHPHLFISDCYATDYTQMKRVSRDEQLSNLISKTLKEGGNTLIATDTAGRALEIAHLLEQQWTNNKDYNLVMLNSVTQNVLGFAKTMIEWMNDKCNRAMEMENINPFKFKFLQVCHSMEECRKISEPKVVLASMPDLEGGFSRELFTQWCGNSKNSIVLTSLTSPGTLARTLIDDPRLSKVILKLKKKVPLEGKELSEYRKKEMHQNINVKIEEFDKPGQLKEEYGDANDDDEKDEEEVENCDWEDPRKTMKHGYNYIINPLKRKASYNLLFSKPCQMFPFKKRKLRQSDLGYDYDIKLFSKSNENTNVVSTTYRTPITDVSSAETKDVPTKSITTISSFDIKANISFFDFDGKSDAEYLKSIISKMKPLQLVLLKGTSSSKDDISNHAISHMPKNGRILIPKLNQPLDCTMNVQVQSIKMSQSLLESLQFKKVKNYHVAWVDAVVAAETNEALEQDEKCDESNQILDKLLDEQESTLKPHDHEFVNNIRLKDFKEILIRKGFKVELKEGTLMINDKIRLSKNGEGSLIPEGIWCKELSLLLEIISEHFVAL